MREKGATNTLKEGASVLKEGMEKAKGRTAPRYDALAKALLKVHYCLIHLKDFAFLNTLYCIGITRFLQSAPDVIAEIDVGTEYSDTYMQ